MTITKIKISTNPHIGQRFDLVIDYKKEAITYKNSILDETHYTKMTEQQVHQLNELKEPLCSLKPRDYLGPITLTGFYWEVDLFTENNKMYEIEGINCIDQKVVDILKQLSSITGYEFGALTFQELL